MPSRKQRRRREKSFRHEYGFVRGQSLAGRIAVGLLYAAAFVPLTYWIDRLAYRNYLRRSGKT